MNRDVIAGSLTLAVGVATLLLVARLPASAGGTAGAAYFPKLVAYGVLATGAFISAQGLRTPVKMVAWSWRPASALVLGVLAFGVLIEHAGLVLASGCCAFAGSLAAPFPSWKQRGRPWRLEWSCAAAFTQTWPRALTSGPWKPPKARRPSLDWHSTRTNVLPHQIRLSP